MMDSFEPAEIISSHYKIWNCGNLSELNKRKDDLMMNAHKIGYRCTDRNSSITKFIKDNRKSIGNALKVEKRFELEIIEVMESTPDTPFKEKMVIAMREEILKKINIPELEILEVYRSFEKLTHILRGAE